MFEMEKHSVGLATQILVMAIVISVMLLFLGMGVLVLIHVWIVGRTLRNGAATERSTNAVERESLGSTSMSQDDIEKLPCFDFAAKASSPAADCAVCLESFRAGERCRLLPSCNHSFHAECVDLWLLRAPVCPICRAAAADDLVSILPPVYGGGGDDHERSGQSFQVVGILDNDNNSTHTQTTMDIDHV
ncbi:RING-H2 finger protein ATL39-like [Salvia miltiorrhiza]|uniref:RING-H2 finger protein ATL39-like n=1 Tax=Salvia miltiorrhiza TaxID=226208 RepID=UPI0025AD07DE|nr:RING-H2 finger protein ATL39-like [Salvia miltiorrhiza]